MFINYSFVSFMEFKFRAWNPKQKRMIYLDPLQWPLHVLESQKDWIVMQYTGFNDKNGKEIYFDDIVAFSFVNRDDVSDNYSGTAAICRTSSNGTGILFDDTDFPGEVIAVLCGGEISDYWEDEDMWTIEVIGNVHKNPNMVRPEYHQK
jgi:uncharacterized phage protein (TIGR01671 family)